MDNKGFSFKAAILLSAGFHCILIGFLIFFLKNGPLLNLDRQVVQIRLAKLGKKRDEALLPRLDVSKEKPKLEEKKENIKKEIEKPKIKELEKKEKKSTKKEQADIKAPSVKNQKTDRKKQKSDPASEKKINPLDVLKKRFGKPIDEGLEKGSMVGDSLNADLEDNYATQVAMLIKESYTLPAILRNQKNQLVVWIRLKINAEGKLLNAEVVRSSGQRVFDNAVLVGVKKIGVFGAPPLQMRRSIATKGIEIEFMP